MYRTKEQMRQVARLDACLKRLENVREAIEAFDEPIEDDKVPIEFLNLGQKLLDEVDVALLAYENARERVWVGETKTGLWRGRKSKRRKRLR